MPHATPSAVRRQIAAGTPDAVYVLQGEDEVEKSALAEEFVGLVDEGLRAFNTERIHAVDMTTGDKMLDGVAELIHAVRTLPMMAPRRVVTVLQAEALLMPKRDSDAAQRALEQLQALIASPVPQTTLVLVSAPLDGRLKIAKLLAKHATMVACGVLEDLAAAEQWVRARVRDQGAEIDPPAARLMAELAGFSERSDQSQAHGDVRRLRAEVDRLMLYALGQKNITVDDVRTMAGPAALQDDWAITNAIEAGDAAEALRQLAMVLDAGGPPEKVLGQLGWVVRAKFPSSAPGQLRAAVDALLRTDLDLKGSGGDPRVLLDRLVVELCAGKRMRGGPARRW
jgi:DNA polymerase III delta subunit